MVGTCAAQRGLSFRTVPQGGPLSWLSMAWFDPGYSPRIDHPYRRDAQAAVAHSVEGGGDGARAGLEVTGGVLRCPAFGHGGEDFAFLRRWVRRALVDWEVSEPHSGNIAWVGGRACDLGHSRGSGDSVDRCPQGLKPRIYAGLRKPWNSSKPPGGLVVSLRITQSQSPRRSAKHWASSVSAKIAETMKGYQRSRRENSLRLSEFEEHTIVLSGLARVRLTYPGLASFDFAQDGLYSFAASRLPR